MDLPTCPSCGQSVLDDDAVDCPFCGASMSGPRTAKTPTNSAQKAAAPKTQKPQSGPKPSAAESAPGSKAGRREPANTPSKAEDDDPFDVETKSSRPAVALHRKPARGRDYRVVCPMCETAGFVSPKAAGRDVKCANPDCLVPVFQSPEIQKAKQEEAAPTKASGSSAGMLIGLAVGLLVIAGGGYWFFNRESPEPSSRPSSSPTRPALPRSPLTAGGDSTEKTDGGTETEVGEPSEPALAAEVIVEQSLQSMIEASLERRNNRSKPFCRRLTAEAHALAGDIPGAREQLTALENLADTVPFYRVTPLVVIAWEQLRDGKPEEAARTLDDAQSAVQPLLQQLQSGISDRDTLETITRLASALVAVGRMEDAKSLIEAQRATKSQALVAALVLNENVHQTYDVDAAVSEGPLLDWESPLWVSVTIELTARGYEEKARQWALQPSEIQIRTDCLVEWAGLLVALSAQGNSADLSSQLESVSQILPLPARARFYAQVAKQYLNTGNRALVAEQSLQIAASHLQSYPVSKEFPLGGLLSVYNLQLPDPVPFRIAAQAAAEIGRVQVRLGQMPEAWASVQTALTHLRALAPSLPAIRERTDAISSSFEKSVVERELKSALELDRGDNVRRAMDRYVQQVEDIRQAAVDRFRNETDLLIHAVEWNLHAEVLDEIATRVKQADIQQREPFDETVLPGLLADRFQSLGNSESASAAEALRGNATVQPNPLFTVRQTATQLIAAQSPEQAAQQLDQALNIGRNAFDRARLIQHALQLACRLVNRNQDQSAFTFASSFRDPTLRETLLNLVSAQAASLQRENTVWRFLEKNKLPPTERIAAYHGLVAGIQSNRGPDSVGNHADSSPAEASNEQE